MDKQTLSRFAILPLILFLFTWLFPAPAHAASPAGYSEYYIPGPEDQLLIFHNAVNNTAFTTTHSVITTVAWSPNTVLYYDHWENGYTFDPWNPEKTGCSGPGGHCYDEKVELAARGDSHVFESAAIPAAPRNPATTYYDGGDRIWSVGGALAVNRVTWPEEAGTVEAIGIEVYPVRPQLTTYIMPVGENLAYGTGANPDFERVFAFVQATEDGTAVQFDIDGDGAAGDTVCTSRDWPCTATATQVTLNAGEGFILDRYASSPTTGDPTTAATPRLNVGAMIQGSDTLQVNYFFCNVGSNYNSRGISAFPTGLWDTNYYTPVGSDTGYDAPTDIYIFNPQSTDLTITYKSLTGSGTFTVPPNATASYYVATGSYAEQNSATFLQGSDEFWGFYSVDRTDQAFDWSDSLIPSTLLTDEYYIGWAPGAEPPNAGDNVDDSGIFITAAQDNVRVFIDTDSDGTADYTYDLTRLQSRYVWDPTDGDMSGTNIYATGPITMAYGQNPDYATPYNPAIDTGAAIVPGIEFEELVLSVDKATDPVMVPVTSGSQAVYTLTVSSDKYTVDDVFVVDTLPEGWEYVSGTTGITLADKTTSTADPALSGTGSRTLTWNGLGDMLEHQTITIVFTARTTRDFAVGDITRNFVEATGYRTIGDPAVKQTFTASDFVFNTYTDASAQMTIEKTSSGIDPLAPGDGFTYTVVVTNTGTAAISNVALYDPLPAGLSYVTDSADITGTKTVTATDNARDTFSTASYSANNGSASWAGSWVESDSPQSPTAGNVLITGGQLRLGRTSSIYRQVDLSGLRPGIDTATLTLDYSTSGNIDPGEYAYIEVAGSESGPWTTGSFENDQSGSVNYAIPSTLWTAATTLRIRTSGYDRNEYLYIDNADITYTHPDQQTGTFAASAPPNFAVTGDGYTMAPGATLVLTFDVTVNSPLETGIESATNTACATADGFFVAVCDDAVNIINNPTAASATVGDRVWYDVDGDGVQDVSEPGLVNVEVTLKDKYGAAVAVTVTGGNGAYLFEGVEPDTGYYVQATGGLPAGLAQSYPVGRTDGRTNPFDLAAGQTYLLADLGYTASPAGALIGDYAWNDADGDRVQDAGEAALAGITVALWQDTDGDGELLGAGYDTLLETTVTGADGKYLFSVASPAGNTYFSVIDPAQAALTGYTATTRLVWAVTGLTGGASSLINDFGFRNATATYTLTDRVWLDTDEDENDDAAPDDNAEAGIAGVTVDLLNASRVVIATTETDSTGHFTFSGLPGGTADYTIRITDTYGRLSDYYGTTASAVSGEWAVDNLDDNIDYTAEPSEPHFGYNIKAAVGDTVFNDANGNGVQDAGEAGISGVTVNLYQDVNADGLLDGGDTLAASLVTDASGYYTFSGLAAGNYIVSIPTPPGGYTYTTESPDNDPAAGDQQASSLSGGSSDLDRDFGYQVPPAVQRSVSGTVWEDADQNGAIDTGEIRLAGVTVELLDSLDAVIASATTNASGYYEFTGLQSGDYTIVITDTGGILTDYATTYEVTEGAGAGSYNGLEAADLNTGSAADINFGYINPRTTLAVIGQFSAYSDRGTVTVCWQTLSELGTVGFNLYRLDRRTGAYRKVNDDLLPGLLHAPEGGRYSYRDQKARANAYYTYRLEEIEAGGRRLSYGPWTVFAGGPPMESPGALAAHACVPGFRQAAKPAPPRTLLRREARSAAISAATADRDARTGYTAKISISDDGIYFISADDIAQTMNLPRGAIDWLIAAGKFSLQNKGRPVATLTAADGDGLYFYGQKAASPYTDSNIYWLAIANGTKMQTLASAPTAPAVDERYFLQTVRAEQSRYAAVTLFDDPQADFWMWDYVMPKYGITDVSVSLASPDVAAQGAATLQVALQGATEAFEGDDHHATVSVNGIEVGEARWNGIDAITIFCQFDPSLLADGDNTIVITGAQVPGVPYNIFYLNHVTLDYPRRYAARNNHLVFYGAAPGELALAGCGGCGQPVCENTVAAGGFTDPDILVFDITDPRIPQVLRGVDIHEDATTPGRYTALFQAGYEASRYAAAAPGGVKHCTLVADQPSSLQSPDNQAQHLIVAPAALIEAAQDLADYRTGCGLTSLVVDLEDIYDEFSYGIVDPGAIRSFLRYAYTRWIVPPEYVVLAGEGSFDYKNELGNSDCMIPPLLTATPEGLFVSDNLYADVVGDDGLADIAIGRIPAAGPEELADYIAKVVSYEAAQGTWTAQALLAADAPDAGGSFPASSEEVATLLPGSMTLERIYLDAVAIDEARALFVAGINEGRRFVNFVGHGGITLLGNADLFSVDSLALLDNNDRQPVVTAMTCAAGNFGYPGYDSLSEAMVLKHNGGATAMWSPSGLGYNDHSMILCRGFYASVFQDGLKTLGDAILSAHMRYAASGNDLCRLNLYNLIGDPGLVLR